MKITVLAALLITFVVGFAQADETALPVQDADFGCIDKTKAEQYVRDYRIDIASFGGFELCNAEIDTKKLFNDLLIIEAGKFRADGKNVFIREFVPQNNYYGWMKSQTRSVNRGNDIPFATAYNRGGHFTMQDGWAKLSTLGRVGVVIHEARHTEGYIHIRCNQGPYQDSSVPGCDRDYEYGGSHAIEMEYYARVVVRGENFHPVYKTMARMMALGRANFTFNKAPIKAREALVIRIDDKLMVVDGEKSFSRALPSYDGRLKRTSFGVSLAKLPENLAIDLYAMLSAPTFIKDDYSYFKLLQENRGKDPKEIMDFEEVDRGSKRFAYALDKNSALGRYQFAEGTWGRFTPTNNQWSGFVTTSPSGAEGLFLKATSGSLFAVNLETGRVDDSKEAWPADAKSFAKLGSRLFKTTTNNEVLFKDGANDWQKWEIPMGQRLEIIKTQLYDGFQVE